SPWIGPGGSEGTQPKLWRTGRPNARMQLAPPRRAQPAAPRNRSPRLHRWTRWQVAQRTRWKRSSFWHFGQRWKRAWPTFVLRGRAFRGRPPRRRLVPFNGRAGGTCPPLAVSVVATVYLV